MLSMLTHHCTQESRMLFPFNTLKESYHIMREWIISTFH
jgi:hypothetical protein